MRIDATHRPWIAASAGVFGVLAISYIAYSATAPQGPRGGTWPGLAYGAAGYGLMLYAALLGARKKVPVWRIGRAKTWMRGHLWLGLLSLPVILFHCGFAWNGTLAAVLMALLFFTVGSGVLGAVLQHYLPSLMTRAVPMETIYEEIPHVRRQLCEEADRLAASIAGTAEAADTFQAEVDPGQRARFGAVYAGSIRPMLLPERAPESADFEPVFESLRKMLPAGVHPILSDIENICEEERQMQRQKRIYRWLHGWLLVHVPLSIALLVLGAIHAVMALRY